MAKGTRLTHVDEAGSARMVDVSAKPAVMRTATAAGRISLAPHTVELIRENALSKGDVLTVAKIAGVVGAKRTAELIPLTHLIEIEHVDVTLELEESGVAITATARCTGKTGIEMEALTAVSIAALTIYDMCKAVDRTMEIGAIHLVEKTKQPSPAL
ncbi:MAG: cyclic pyranopterin monophosphate synthase MoaC [Spirochaeta sp.]|jgi:cyclic pyranopterin phosphate synthase|nr:cyclic pyranopterin monophosphate synthase MoaC [Spirochaeta sp.]